MSLMRWKKPSSDLASGASDDIFSLLQRDINSLFNNFGLEGGNEKYLTRKNNWNPLVEFKETPSDYVLHADLPGFDKKDVHVTFEDNVLTLKGERKSEETKKDDKVHYTERFYGSFERSFALPEKRVDKDKISAKFENGVLSVHLGKAQDNEKEPRKINIL